MRKIIAAINLTLDGVCDHTVGVPDDALHEHYRELISDADAILYGRITYELMRYWQGLVKQPSGEKSMDDFAEAMDRIPKVVFSRSLKDTEWDSARLSVQSLEQTVLELRQQSGGNVLVGSRSLIMQLMKLSLIDEYQFCIHPVIAGKGLRLFDQINDLTMFNLLQTKVFKSGAIVLYYKRA